MQSDTRYFLKKYITIFIILYATYYIPIDTRASIGIPKLILMGSMIIMLLVYSFQLSKALIIGTLYLTWQFLSASFHPESWRWSTLLLSTALVYTYVGFYNIVVVKKALTINHFIKICKWIMMAYFVVCIMQQIAIIIGFNTLPIINYTYSLERGIGCYSLAREPSTFGRFMLVFYYAYIKCNEYKRGEGPFTLKELFSGEHKGVTLRFLWMMLTMGSGTAFVCLILLSLYFVRRHNWYYVIPILAIGYSLIQASGIEALDRATSTIEATATLDAQTVRETDGSAAARITPVLNSLNADFTKFDTWFGKGIDAGHAMGSKNTIFDDYGFIFYLISMILNFSCACNFWSLATIFILTGVGGSGAGSNIQYAWTLMMVMTCVKYFHDNQNNPEIYEEEEQDNIEEGKTALLEQQENA